MDQAPLRSRVVVPADALLRIGNAPFVGRERELAMLDAELAAALLRYVAPHGAGWLLLLLAARTEGLLASLLGNHDEVWPERDRAAPFPPAAHRARSPTGPSSLD